MAGVWWEPICEAGSGNAVGGVWFPHLLRLPEWDEPGGNGGVKMRKCAALLRPAGPAGVGGPLSLGLHMEGPGISPEPYPAVWF